VHLHYVATPLKGVHANGLHNVGLEKDRQISHSQPKAIDQKVHIMPSRKLREEKMPEHLGSNHYSLCGWALSIKLNIVKKMNEQLFAVNLIKVVFNQVRFPYLES
jgi:hypothetical protein